MIAAEHFAAATPPVAMAAEFFDRLRALSADPPGVTRPSFSPIETAAHAEAAAVAEGLGLEIARDHIGNLYMTLPGADRSAPRVLTGSHMDSVPHGGNFDGAAGVVAGLAALKALIAQGFQPKRDVTVMAIRAEEICWFPHHYLGSQAAFGLLKPGAVDTLKRSDDGRSLAEHMTAIGLDPAKLRAAEPSLKPQDVHAFIELHIEQGPQLDGEAIPVGIVTAIRGNMRYRHCKIEGAHSHAGAVPRAYRRDAVMAGTEFVQALEAIWDERDAAGVDFVCTVGEFGTDPTLHAMTKVPGHVGFTMDIRSENNAVLLETDARLRAIAEEISSRRGVAIDLGPYTNAVPAAMDPEFRAILSTGAERMGIPARDIASGAGHDCATFAAQGVRSAMVFVRNQNTSHNPDEAMELGDFAKATAVLAALLGEIGGA